MPLAGAAESDRHTAESNARPIGSPEIDCRWHRSPVAEVLLAFGTDPQRGLDPHEASRRLTRVGPNRLPEPSPVSPWTLFVRQLRNPLVLVLIAALVVTTALGEWIDAAAIAAIVLLNSVLGFVQEYRAERALQALQRLTVDTATVVRGGERMSIPSEHVVPGDLLTIDAGDAIAADARVVWTAGLRTEEASLTGESTPVTKTADPVQSDSLADLTNTVFLGTWATAGKARAVVTRTGVQTELGRIARLVGTAGRDTTPLERRLDQLGATLWRVAAIAVALMFVLGLARGEALTTMILTAVSIGVAAIPEGLPAMVTIALALGVTRMARRHAIVRRLAAVETLGAATVICTDKTGTLTRGEMVVTRLFVGKQVVSVQGQGYAPVGTLESVAPGVAVLPASRALLRCAVLASDARLIHDGDDWRVVGDPTEGALVAAAAKIDLRQDTLEREWPRVAEIPFDADRKRMTIVRRDPDKRRLVACVKGAPEVLLPRCSRVMEADGTIVPIDLEWRTDILRTNADFASQALRVLAIAEGSVDTVAPLSPDAAERDLIWLGMVAMSDRPRPEAIEAVATCHDAGIRTVVITGDHRETAVAIARELKMLGPSDEVITGTELDAMTDEQLRARVAGTAVYARVSAEHKLRIVRAWRSTGAVVAMTGDGVNDAPALREADIGVAMGRTGTAVAREASDLVIADDNFASIVAAVAEGRRVFANIRKAITYLLSCNLSEILVMLIATLAGMPLPLLPVQILWLNLVTDGLPALALTVEPPGPDLMVRPPRHAEGELLDAARATDIARHGTFMALGAIALFVVAETASDLDLAHGRTLIFTALVCSQLVHALNCRSDRHSLFTLGVFGNPLLLAAVASSLLLQWTVTMLPATGRLLGVVPLTLGEWAMAGATGILPLAGMELEKAWRRHRARETR